MNTTPVENIIACYSRGTVAQIREGMSWYSDAHALAIHIANGDVWRGAGVISALSPRQPWPRNVTLARRAFSQGYATGQTKAMNRVANAILSGVDPMVALKGDKTRAFAMGIATNGMHDTATIDRHAFDIAAGKVFTDKTRPAITKSVYREIAKAYEIAAEELHMTVCQTQAVTWVIWRNEKGL